VDGVDTVKVVQPLQHGTRLHLRRELRADPKVHGRQGSVWYNGYRTESGELVVAKGVGAASGHLIWEGSAPKLLGLAGPADAENVRDLLAHLHRQTGGLFDGSAYLTRLDVTADRPDPDGLLRIAAIGWHPHPRARYVQAIYEGTETVWQHNKTRGFRVYDKGKESGESWAQGLTRVEYQLRGDWVAKNRLRDPWDPACPVNVAAVRDPFVRELEERAQAFGYEIAEASELST